MGNGVSQDGAPQQYRSSVTMDTNVQHTNPNAPSGPQTGYPNAPRGPQPSYPPRAPPPSQSSAPQPVVRNLPFRPQQPQQQQPVSPLFMCYVSITAALTHTTTDDDQHDLTAI